MPSVTYTERTYTYTTDTGTTTSITVYEASDGTRGSVRHMKWDVCPVCGLEYPEDKFAKVGGRKLCIPSGCYRDNEYGR